MLHSNRRMLAGGLAPACGNLLSPKYPKQDQDDHDDGTHDGQLLPLAAHGVAFRE